MKTATFSEFIRHPTEVLDRAAGDDIRLTRRGDEDLVVSSAGHHDTSHQVLDQLSRLIAASLDDATCDRLAGNLENEMAWLAFLPTHSRRRFVGDYFRSARACASIGDFRPLTIEIEAWRETAAAHAAGLDPAGADLETLPDGAAPIVDPRRE